MTQSAAMPKLWFLGHPFNGRRPLKLRVRDWEDRKWRTGSVRIEWGDAEQAGAAALPAVGDGNIDPLVVGPRMYYDYCKRTASTNGFVSGDTILFGSYSGKHGGLVVDTVFVVGEHGDWPSAKDLIPDWPDVDQVALRVHFNARSHQVEHPEVHRMRPLAHRSYRSRSAAEDHTVFSWVPYMEVVEALPFVLPKGSEPLGILKRTYGHELREHVQGRFAVETLREEDMRILHEGLRTEAAEQGFRIAVETALLSMEEVEAPSIRGSCFSHKASQGGHRA